jgi:hypothetical protein
MYMNPDERLNLKKLINANECDDNTEQIRELKHSVKIRNDIALMQSLKKKNARMYKNDPDRLQELCKAQCSFLYNSYTDIFHKVYKDEIDMNIMSNLLNILKQIEDGKVDQHEGSVLVGKILKELYVDSALKRCDNINNSIEQTPEHVFVESKQISWKQYKQMN